MKPFEHYLEAERLLEAMPTTNNSWEQEQMVARAGVHAQLAMAPLGDQENLVNLNDVEGFRWNNPESDGDWKTFSPDEVEVLMRPGYIKR